MYKNTAGFIIVFSTTRALVASYEVYTVLFIFCIRLVADT